MKKTLLALCMVMFSVMTCMGQDGRLNAVQADLNGQKPVVFFFAENPVITMPENLMRVEAGERVLECLRSDVRMLEMVYVEPTAIEQIASEKIAVLCKENGKITIVGLKAGQCVTVSGVNGALIAKGVADGAGRVSLTIQAKAVNIINIDGVMSFKTIGK